MKRQRENEIKGEERGSGTGKNRARDRTLFPARRVLRERKRIFRHRMYSNKSSLMYVDVMH